MAAGAGVRGRVDLVVNGEGWEEVVGVSGPWVLLDVAGESLVLCVHHKGDGVHMVDTYPDVKE